MNIVAYVFERTLLLYLSQLFKISLGVITLVVKDCVKLLTNYLLINQATYFLGEKGSFIGLPDIF